jgi:serine/threonine-protein kinase
MTPVAGATLAAGRYRLERRLGAGGMASVWLAHDERLDRAVAVKLIADTLAGEPQWAARFTREARAAAAVTHPNVVDVYDYGLEDGHPYLVMAHVAGPNLAQHLRDPDRAALDPETVAREVLGALEAVHRAGIVHRDVKAANVLLDRRGRAHLADFGIAQAEDATSLTQTGMIVGTLRYLAPELAAGAPATAASDLFAVGVLARELAAVGPRGGLDALADALTRVDPADRPRTAGDAIRLLDDARRETARTVVAPGPGAPDPREDATAGTIARPAYAATSVTRPAATAATKAHPVRDPASPGPAVGATSSRARPVGAHLRRPPVLAAVVVLILLLAVGFAASREDPAEPRPRPAPASAPLTTQVDALQSIVDDARR